MAVQHRTALDAVELGGNAVVDLRAGSPVRISVNHFQE
jgi:hypothetical protein